MHNDKQITDLRGMLFAQMERLTDSNCNLDKEIMRSNALVNVSEQIINSVKVEVAFIQATGVQHTTGFIPNGKLLENGTHRLE